MIRKFCSSLVLMLFCHCLLWADCPAGTLSFKAWEMAVMPVEEYQSYNLKDSTGLTDALKAYHTTRTYDQTLEEFLQDPGAYFGRRLSALDQLLAAIPPIKEEPYDTIRQQAENKRLYILALPSMLDSRALKPEVVQRVCSKALPLRDSYWHEQLDPLHRAGKAVVLRQRLWQFSEVPNYFIFLESIEYDSVLNKYAPQKSQVIYYNDEEQRAKHRITFKDGLAYLGDELFDTANFRTLFLGSGFAIYVLGEDRQFYINNHIKDRLHHSSEFAGMPILAGGEIAAVQGKIVFLNNKSGHYIPTLQDFLPALDILKDNVGNLDAITTQIIFVKGSREIKVIYNAADLQATQGECLSAVTKGAITPLHVAVWREQLGLAEQALACSPIDAQNEKGETALHYAVVGNSPAWAAKLLNHGANAAVFSEFGHTPLHVAAAMGNQQLVELLYPYTDDDLCSKAGETPLMLAAKSGNRETYDFLLNKGFSLEAMDNGGNTILTYAILSRKMALLADLLQEGHAKKLPLLNTAGASLLHAAAAFTRNPGVLDLLIGCGLDPLAVDGFGNTLLHYAVKHNNGRVVDYLLKNGMAGMFSMKNHQGQTPLHVAAATSDSQFLQYLLQFIDDVNPIDNAGNTPLFHAIMHDQQRNILALAAKKANFQHFNADGFAPIHVAAMTYEPNVLYMLAQSDDFALEDARGNMPLHIALMCKDLSAAKYLIAHSKPEHIRHKNQDGLNAIDVAVNFSQPKKIIGRLLRRLNEN